MMPMGFGVMSSLFPILFTAVFLLIFVLFIVTLVHNVGQWRRNNRSPHYRRIEAGKVNISALTLCTLADYFDVTTDYLLGRSPASVTAPEGVLHL